ncbi:S8 family peptidase [Natronosalvus halobius]|uniref:S8 family peptidase n=1 Tax=Natronosalvus halobius TaxID=2953746 RepID=UPI00209FE3F4|nr:S8 family serine peptidase [Natronosalvus halobius]USZ73798.1 S8 family serine peptidase [Natronosalvus halobius]
MTQYTRRQYLLGVGTLPLASIAPADRELWWSPPDDAVSYSEGRYGFIVSVEPDSLEEFREDVEGYDNVSWLESREHAASGTVTIVAPPGDIGIRQRDRAFGNGLAHLSYVESVELNRTISLADPIEPAGSNAWSGTGFGTQNYLKVFGEGALSKSGVAFDSDMQEGPIGNVHTHTRADAVTVDTSGLTIGVVDTGVNYGEAIPESRLLSTSTDFTDGDATGTDAVEDTDGHGSWVASCMASELTGDYAGFLPAADVLGCKALEDGQGTIDDIAAGIRHAADEGADVMCLSLGSFQFSQAIQNALEYAVEQGTIPVAANGNDRQMSRWLSHPASSEQTIAVGSTTAALPSESRSAYYSNIGPHNGISDNSGGETQGAMPDIGAPGCKLTAQVPQPSGSDSLETLTGTSMAAPVVAGVIGLYLAENPGTDFETVREGLHRTAAPIPNAAEEEIGHGMPDAEALLAGTEPDTPQAEAMTDEAETRGVAYSTLSGGMYPRLLASAQQRF